MEEPHPNPPPLWCGRFEKVPLVVIITLFLLNFIFMLPLISIPVTPIFEFVHLNVTVGEVNGSLTLGTLGYCLEVSDQKICHPSPPRLAYNISQFFSNHRISSLVLIFCDFKDNTQIIAQLTTDANNKIHWFSIANLAVLVCGIIVPIFYGCATRCARPDPRPLSRRPNRWSHFFTMLDAFGIMCATSSALVGILSVFVALWFESLLVRNQFHESVGKGFWYTAAIGAIFVIIFIIMFARFVKVAMAVHEITIRRRRIQPPPPQDNQQEQDYQLNQLNQRHQRDQRDQGLQGHQRHQRHQGHQQRQQNQLGRQRGNRRGNWGQGNSRGSRH